MSLRVVSTDERLTKPARSMMGAEERARRVALLVGYAEIQQRTGRGEWHTLERWHCDAGRVTRGQHGR